MGSGQTTTPPATKPSKSESSSGSGSSLEDPLLDPLTTSSKRSEKGTRAGAMSWEAAMGVLGRRLYSALAGHLTEAKLVGYANSGVAKATSMLKAWMKDQINPSDAEIADKFHKALTATLEQLVKEAMSADGGGMAEAIAQLWTRTRARSCSRPSRAPSRSWSATKTSLRSPSVPRSARHGQPLGRPGRQDQGRPQEHGHRHREARGRLQVEGRRDLGQL